MFGDYQILNYVPVYTDVYLGISILVHERADLRQRCCKIVADKVSSLSRKKNKITEGMTMKVLYANIQVSQVILLWFHNFETLGLW